MHDKDLVRIHDGVEPMGDSEHRAPGKLLANRLLLSRQTIRRVRRAGGRARRRDKERGRGGVEEGSLKLGVIEGPYRGGLRDVDAGKTCCPRIKIK